MKNNFTHLALLSMLTLSFFACSKSPQPSPMVAKMKVAEATTSGASFKVALYAADSLFVGYNRVNFKIIDQASGLEVHQANLSLHPLMDMGTFSHACPFENPPTQANSEGNFEGAVLFSMMGTNSWSLSADIVAQGKTETVKLMIPKVIATVPAQKIVVIDSVIVNGVLTQTKYPISLLKPSAWKVGMNPFEITIHCMQDMMNFPASTDFSVAITPEMPSMGHGSPNNVNPVHVGNGHYSGTVNFTMTGAWRVNLLIKKGDRVVSNKAYFDINF